MIVPIKGNVFYTITLDPTVWIFDDRKILLEDAFNASAVPIEEKDEAEAASERFNREVYEHQIKPPVNRSVSRMEGKEILANSYVMPIRDFLENAEVKSDATAATIVTKNGTHQLTLDELHQSYFLFAVDGKPLKEDGPVHLYYGDGSNQEDPIRNVSEIIIE
ncbi:hypothetical protein ACFOGI_08060 [Virgibacillus xinjiangensis]|uniref:Peptidyl-prolyl cis-trans isomerase n=1 Tax=Virgibacillus xinjiangensis TaxID=393090 RepID=A0ABV7CUP8_9BACI